MNEQHEQNRRGLEGKGLPVQMDAKSLSGQQMQALAKNHAETLAAIKRDVELRKWAVDQACGLCGTAIEANDGKSIIDPVELAKAIHAFLIEGAEKAE